MDKIISVTVEQMREVDRIMIDEIGVSILMMMENASRNIAVLTRMILGGSLKNKKIIILCGKGNNGGDGLGAARHLINFGANVICIISENASMLGKETRTQFYILKNINAKLIEFSDKNYYKIEAYIKSSDLIIDALLGYNMKGNPKKPISTLIHLSNNARKPILAIDIPSGLNGDTGLPNDPTMKATTTITLALPKVGLLKKSAREHVGKLYVADLSIPKKVYTKIGIEVPFLFENNEIMKIK